MRIARITSFQEDHIRCELDTLTAELALAKERLVSPSPVQAGKVSPSKPRFSFTSPFHLGHRRSQKKTYNKIGEQAGLLSFRRGSGASDITLVEDEPDPASRLLSVLAPLVSGVQRVGPRIPGCSPDITGHFEEVCQQLESVIVDLQCGSCMEGDEHDLEMRGLMLSALLKKVQAERHAHTSQSPLAPKSLNPFIVHATSLDLDVPRLNPTRRVSIAKPIASVGGASSSYSSSAGNAQSSTWAMNVIRLGSFQNSMLFSPSPVAVRKMVGRVKV